MNILQRAARTTALVIVPLAAAVSAYAGGSAGPVLPRGNAACSMVDDGNPAVCSSGAYNIPLMGPSGLTGVSLFTPGSVTFYDGDTAQLTLSASGKLFGGAIPSGSTIPLAYVFGLQFEDGDVDASVSSWTLDFQLLDGRTVIGDSGTIDNTPINNTDISNQDGQFFTGSSSMTTTGSAALGDTLTELVTLDVDWFTGDADNLIVSVPGAASFDYQSTANLASTPEPGTVIPLACILAIAGLYLWRVKSKPLTPPALTRGRES